MKHGAEQDLPEHARLDGVGDVAVAELSFVELNQSTKARRSRAAEKAKIPLAVLFQTGNLVRQVGIVAVVQILGGIVRWALFQRKLGIVVETRVVAGGSSHVLCFRRFGY